jgi:hypothetical protein
MSARSRGALSPDFWRGVDDVAETLGSSLSAGELVRQVDGGAN